MLTCAPLQRTAPPLLKRSSGGGAVLGLKPQYGHPPEAQWKSLKLTVFQVNIEPFPFPSSFANSTARPPPLLRSRCVRQLLLQYLHQQEVFFWLFAFSLSAYFVGGPPLRTDSDILFYIYDVVRASRRQHQRWTRQDAGLYSVFSRHCYGARHRLWPPAQRCHLWARHVHLVKGRVFILFYYNLFLLFLVMCFKISGFLLFLLPDLLKKQAARSIIRGLTATPPAPLPNPPHL